MTHEKKCSVTSILSIGKIVYSLPKVRIEVKSPIGVCGGNTIDFLDERKKKS